MRTLLLAGLLTAVGCGSSAKMLSYELPTAEAEFQGPSAVRLSKKELLKKTIDALTLSGIFDPLFIDDFPSIWYELRVKRNKAQGSFTFYNQIEFFIQPSKYYPAMFFEDTNQDMQKSLFLAGSHELSHYFWQRHLSDKQRDQLRNNVRKYYTASIDIYNFAGSKFASADLCASQGLTLETYYNFRRWINAEPFYKKWYPKNNFDEFYFGTEAFAYLQEGQVEALLPYLPLVSRSTRASPLPKNIWKLSKIPQNLQKYYWRFFNDKFFDNNP